MQWDADEQTEFLDAVPGGLAETVFYYPSFGDTEMLAVWDSAIVMEALFRRPFEALNLTTGQVEMSAPTLLLREDDASLLTYKDRFVVSGQGYIVNGIEPDGKGFVAAKLVRE